MPVFISYSHRDSDFVDELAKQLVKNDVSVWVDRWELSVGDSLMSRLQSEIAGASALLVILSNGSVTSPWCEKEINGGLLRELEERRVVVLPVLIEDCKVPLFLRDKVFADFRASFDVGLRSVLEGIARVTNANMGRIDEPRYYSDWAIDTRLIDWGRRGDRYFSLRVVIVMQAHRQPYTVLISLETILDDRAAINYEAELGQAGRTRANQKILRRVVDHFNSPKDLVFILDDPNEQVQDFNLNCEIGTLDTRISARLLGNDTGRSVRVRAGDQLKTVVSRSEEISQMP